MNFFSAIVIKVYFAFLSIIFKQQKSPTIFFLFFQCDIYVVCIRRTVEQHRDPAL